MGANTFTSVTPKLLAPIVEIVPKTKTDKRTPRRSNDSPAAYPAPANPSSPTN